MNLAEYRTHLGLTQEQCAEALGLRHKARVWEIENGKTPPVELAFKIEKWSRGSVKAADLNPTVALVLKHVRRSKGRAS